MQHQSYNPSIDDNLWEEHYDQGSDINNPTMNKSILLDRINILDKQFEEELQGDQDDDKLASLGEQVNSLYLQLLGATTIHDEIRKSLSNLTASRTSAFKALTTTTIKDVVVGSNWSHDDNNHQPVFANKLVIVHPW